MAVGEQEIVPWEQPVTEVRWVRHGRYRLLGLDDY
jgi:hypothetical protein